MYNLDEGTERNGQLYALQKQTKSARSRKELRDRSSLGSTPDTRDRSLPTKQHAALRLSQWNRKRGSTHLRQVSGIKFFPVTHCIHILYWKREKERQRCEMRWSRTGVEKTPRVQWRSGRVRKGIWRKRNKNSAKDAGGKLYERSKEKHHS